VTQLTSRNGPRRLVLGDGGVVLVRPLERSDRAELAAAIARLSDKSRYFRFAAAKPRMTERELDHLVDVDHHGHEALLALDPRSGRGIAVARYVPVFGEPGVVEIAVTVADEWQGRGLGSALLRRLIGRAIEEGHTTLRASTLAANDRSIAMLRRAGFGIRPSTGALRDYELVLM
jgi:GNAT superfamily N-acetyltransferase